MRTTILTAVLLALGAIIAVRSPAKEIVEIRVRGHYYAAPATVPIVVAVEPGEQNRVLLVEADAEEYYRSSEIELDGERVTGEERFNLGIGRIRDVQESEDGALWVITDEEEGGLYRLTPGR